MEERSTPVSSKKSKELLCVFIEYTVGCRKLPPVPLRSRASTRPLNVCKRYPSPILYMVGAPVFGLIVVSHSK